MRKNLFITFIVSLLINSVFAQGEIISPETYASYYAEAFHGRQTANGEIFDMNAYTAAHKTLPFGTILEVTNLENGKKVIVRINDRGPYVGNREIDISKAAAAALDMLSRGVTRVSLRKIDPSDRIALGIPKEEKEVFNKTELLATKSTPKLSDLEQPVAPSPRPTPEKISSMLQEQLQPEVEPEKTYEYAQASKYAEKRDIPKEEKKPVYTPVMSEFGTGPLWRIQLGAFTREENAMRLVLKLRKINFDPAYEKTQTHTRVVLYGISPVDLEKVKQVLEEHSFNDYVLRQERW